MMKLRDKKMINLFEVRRWISRRITTFDHHNLHWPRNTPKHFGLFAFILSLIFFYFFLSRSFRPNKIISARHCVADFLEKNGIRQPWEENGKTLDDWQQSDKMAFVGNGFIGLETYADRKLMIFANESGGTRPYNLLTGFSPLVDVTIPLAIQESIVFTDNNGMARNVRCSVLSEKCVCVINSVYAHRTRPGLLVQHVQLVNPSSSTFTVSFKTKSSAFEQREGHHSPIYTKTFDEGKTKALVVIMCTSAPKTGITLKPKIEENFRFICYLEKGPAGNEAALISSVSAKFGAIFALKSDQIDAEHSAAWETLNSANFSLSHSKVPNSLNQFDIEKMRTLLLSSMPFDINAFGANKNSIILDSAYCFTGISTMLTPSKLWQKSSDLASLLRQIDIWKTTLEHRGCSTLIKKYGAHGFAQAFLLSLSAAMFSNGAKRLEFALNPQTELQRNIKIDGLRIGIDAVIALEFQLDLGLKPFVIIQNRNPTQTLYACTAGCQESPHSIGKEPIKLPIKMTRPTTSILFLSQHIYELELLKKTLHVNEIFDAPAHDQDKIDLHKHGHAGEGLPTIFWVILVFMLIAFHLFLFKLLYSEWQNSSTMPYSKFNKKVLFRR